MGVNGSKVKESQEEPTIMRCTALVEDNVTMEVSPTPTKIKDIDKQVDKVEQKEILLDPRSPNNDRTPIQVPSAGQQQQRQIAISVDNPFAFLRRHLFKGAAYSLNDPRSPSQQLNRTPLVIEGANEKTFNLDDTFSNLSVETRTEGVALNYFENKDNESAEVLDVAGDVDAGGVAATPIILSSTPKTK